MKELPPWTPFSECAWPEDVRATFEAEPGYVGVFRNSRYQVVIRVQQTVFGPVDWLSIVRIDREPIHDWREFQRIKNELLGVEREGVELYPAESRLVDTTNQYHLFVLPIGSFMPFGYAERDVTETIPEGSVNKQRPFEVKPVDLDAGSGHQKYQAFLRKTGRADG